MKSTEPNNPLKGKQKHPDPDITSPDKEADKTGTDWNADKTQKAKGNSKYDKPVRETNPDRTGIDTNADKTKKHK